VVAGYLKKIITLQRDYFSVMSDLISLPRHLFGRGHPVSFWIPAFAGMTGGQKSIAEKRFYYANRIFLTIYNQP